MKEIETRSNSGSLKQTKMQKERRDKYTRMI